MAVILAFDRDESYCSRQCSVNRGALRSATRRQLTNFPLPGNWSYGRITAGFKARVATNVAMNFEIGSPAVWS
jgi:hypothetical protein